MPGRRRFALLTKLSANRSPDSRSAVVDELRRVILEGGAPPDSPIPINDVAEVLGVSAIPVRESLKTLVAEGLVALLTATELAEMYIVRETLESAALAAAVDDASEADRTAVAAAHRLLERAGAGRRPALLPPPEPALPHRDGPAVGDAAVGAHARIRLEHTEAVQLMIHVQPSDRGRAARRPRSHASGRPRPRRR